MLKDIFNVPKAVIGMIHLSALPGTEAYEQKKFSELAKEAVDDARILEDAGFDAVLFQNTHDIPALTRVHPETIAYMTAIGLEIKRCINLPIGVNIHKVDATATLAIASVLDSPFVRLKVYVGAMLDAQGIVNGCAIEALAYRKKMKIPCQIWCDIYDITSWPLVNQPIGEMAHWALKFGKADSLILTGRSFTETMERAKAVHVYRPDADIILGGGITHENVKEALAIADAVIIGSSLEKQRFTRPISSEKAHAFMKLVNQVREIQ